MRTSVYVPPLGGFLEFLDVLMVPVMRFGTYAGESTQRNHKWNWTRVSLDVVRALHRNWLAGADGIPGEKTREELGWRLHMPRFGGWKHYVVLEAGTSDPWYVGWATKDFAGISRVQIIGNVRMLVGPEDVLFFAIRAGDYRQAPLTRIGEGVIGDGCPSRMIALN